MPKQVAVSADLVSAEIGPNSFEPDVELAHVVGTTWWKGQSGVQQKTSTVHYIVTFKVNMLALLQAQHSDFIE